MASIFVKSTGCSEIISRCSLRSPPGRKRDSHEPRASSLISSNTFSSARGGGSRPGRLGLDRWILGAARPCAGERRHVATARISASTRTLRRASIVALST